MKKCVLFLFPHLFPLTFLFTFLFILPQPSEASRSVGFLELTGVFVSLDTTVTPNVITLAVDGKKASGPLHEDCIFYDKTNQGNPSNPKRALSREAFVRLLDYLSRLDRIDKGSHKIVTVEIDEETGQVLSCRIGS